MEGLEDSSASSAIAQCIRELEEVLNDNLDAEPISLFYKSTGI